MIEGAAFATPSTMSAKRGTLQCLSQKCCMLPVMARQSSFDIVSKVNLAEAKNAVNQALKEVRQRFDLKNSQSDIQLHADENKIVLISVSYTHLTLPTKA